MSQWLTPDLHVKSLSAASEWELTKKLVYMYQGEPLEVPAGTQTDFASIPRALRWRFNINGKTRRAAVLHDHLYGTKWKTRKQCDAVFKSAMRDCGVSRYNAWVMWAGVRAGGWTRGRW